MRRRRLAGEPTVVSNPGGRTLVTNGGSNGKFLGVVELDAAPGRLNGVRYALVPVFPNLLPADPPMETQVKTLRAQDAAMLDETLATAGTLLYRRGNVAGTMDQVIFDAPRHELDAEFSQLSSPGADHRSQVLRVACNVLKVNGPDKVVIDVVAFGPGIDLPREGNPNAERIHSLVARGVRFVASMNSVTTIERHSGKHYPLNPLPQRVEAGVVRITNLAEHGYTTVRP